MSDNGTHEINEYDAAAQIQIEAINDGDQAARITVSAAGNSIAVSLDTASCMQMAGMLTRLAGYALVLNLPNGSTITLTDAGPDSAWD